MEVQKAPNALETTQSLYDKEREMSNFNTSAKLLM